MSARDVAERLRSRKALQKVSTPEGDIWVRGLSGKERATYMEQFRSETEASANLLLADQILVSMALVDENGNDLFGSQEEALAVVIDWDIDQVKEAATVILRMSGMSRDSQEQIEKK